MGNGSMWLQNFYTTPKMVSCYLKTGKLNMYAIGPKAITKNKTKQKCKANKPIKRENEITKKEESKKGRKEQSIHKTSRKQLSKWP